MNEMRVLTAFIDQKDQCDIERYEQNGGYQTIRKVLYKIAPEEVKKMVKDSELRGRGGAGFSTGSKWGFLPKGSFSPRYLICNCDESEPGTFKDRFLIEHDPHQLIEGIILSCYAIESHQAFIYCRGEFYEGSRKLRKAIQQAKEKGYLGRNILNSDYSLEIILHVGAGAYIAGEETAQINSLEGFRATPRLKPPFPAVSGLYGKPTIVNNVETLCNVVHILNKGVDWYRAIGKPKNTGTKIYQISGHIQKPGCYEFPLGVSLKSLLECAGGMLPGRTFKACYPGGSSSSILTAKDIDISLDFESLAARGTALGTASIIVMDNTADMVKVASRLMEFYQNESCGKCTPCREGTRWMVQVLKRIEDGKGTYFDLDTINQVCKKIGENSFCALAIGAVFPVISAIKEFKEEFIEYIRRNPEANEIPLMKMAYPYI